MGALPPLAPSISLLLLPLTLVYSFLPFFSCGWCCVFDFAILIGLIVQDLPSSLNVTSRRLLQDRSIRRRKINLLCHEKRESAALSNAQHRSVDLSPFVRRATQLPSTRPDDTLTSWSRVLHGRPEIHIYYHQKLPRISQVTFITFITMKPSSPLSLLFFICLAASAPVPDVQRDCHGDEDCGVTIIRKTTTIPAGAYVPSAHAPTARSESVPSVSDDADELNVQMLIAAAKTRVDDATEKSPVHTLSLPPRERAQLLEWYRQVQEQARRNARDYSELLVISLIVFVLAALSAWEAVWQSARMYVDPLFLKLYHCPCGRKLEIDVE